MQEIQINESAPRHTKALVVISLVVIVILAFTLAYIFLFSSKTPVTDVPVVKTGTFGSVLATPINTKQQIDEEIPEQIRIFIGKWQGSWVFKNKQTLPTAFAVEDVSQSGWHVTYVNTALPSEKIEAIKGRTTATPTFFKEKDSSVPALQIILPGYKGEGVVTMVFWFTESPDILLGRFTDPVTQEVVTGEFKRLP
jgi:hypothetical protein